MFLNHAVLSCLCLIVVEPGISRVLSDRSSRRNGVHGIMDQWASLTHMNGILHGQRSVMKQRSERDVNSCSCTAELKAKYPDHVLCMNSTDALFGYSLPTYFMEGDIIYYHDRARAEVMPPAADMKNLLWDDCLAKMALNWSKQCRTDRDTKSVYPDGKMARLAQTSSFQTAPKYGLLHTYFFDWIDQRKNWKYGVGSINGNDVSAYTQMISSKATRVGCVVAYCRADTKKSSWFPGSKQSLVCYYLNADTDERKRETEPYWKGKPCSQCSSSSSSGSSSSQEKTFCHHGLCYTCPKDDFYQCGSFLNNCTHYEEQHVCPYMCGLCKSECSRKCQNGGRLNQMNCTCECPRISSGPNCENLKCPETEWSYCPISWDSESKCKQRDEAYRHCPYMCGTCQYNYTNCASLECKNFGGVVPDHKAKTCKCKCRDGFYGDFCEKVDCSKPKDDDFCKKHSCGSIYRHVSSCPYKCNRCKKGCTEIECLNDGVLDQNDCKCKCPATFYGDMCQHKNCTGAGVDSDKYYCWEYRTPRKCFTKDSGRYWRESCPYLCGVCP